MAAWCLFCLSRTFSVALFSQLQSKSKSVSVLVSVPSPVSVPVPVMPEKSPKGLLRESCYADLNT